MNYHEVEPIGREEAENAFASGMSDRIIFALLAVAFHDPDATWAQDKALGFLDFADPDVRAAAATSLGHIARIHGRIDSARVIPSLESLRNDPEIGGQVDDALEDIARYVT